MEDRQEGMLVNKYSLTGLSALKQLCQSEGEHEAVAQQMEKYTLGNYILVCVMKHSVNKHHLKSAVTNKPCGFFLHFYCN